MEMLTVSSNLNSIISLGFTLPTLRAALDIRNIHRADRSLVHFIAEFVEERHTDLMRLKRDLVGVQEASRVE